MSEPPEPRQFSPIKRGIFALSVGLLVATLVGIPVIVIALQFTDNTNTVTLVGMNVMIGIGLAVYLWLYNRD